MLRNQQLLNVSANAPGDIPVAVEINGAAYPLGSAEVRGGTLVLIAHGSPMQEKKPAKPAQNTKAKPEPENASEPEASSEASSGEGIELK